MDPMDPMASVNASTPTTAQVQSVASAAIVEAAHDHPNDNGSLPTTPQNDFVREVLALIHVRPFFSFHLWSSIHLLWFDFID